MLAKIPCLRHISINFDVTLDDTQIRLPYRQKFFGLNCRNFDLVSKILSNEILSDKVCELIKNNTPFTFIFEQCKSYHLIENFQDSRSIHGV